MRCAANEHVRTKRLSELSRQRAVNSSRGPPLQGGEVLLKLRLLTLRAGRTYRQMGSKTAAADAYGVCVEKEKGKGKKRQGKREGRKKARVQ